MADQADISTPGNPAATPAAVDPNSVASSQGSPESAAAAPTADAPPAATELSPPASAPAEAGGQTPDPAADATPKAEPTLLEKWDAEHKKADGEVKTENAAKDAVKPVEEKPVEDKAKVEAEAAEIPKLNFFDGETAVKLPDTIKMNDAERGEFNDAVSAAIAGKGAQGIIDLAAKSFQAYDEQLRTQQWDAFNSTRKTWRDAVMGDEVLGGNRYNTAMGLVAEARDVLMSTADKDSARYKREVQEFNEMLAATGVGDHPAFLRLLHNASRYTSEPKAPSVTNINPPKDLGVKPGSRRDRLYPNTNPST